MSELMNNSQQRKDLLKDMLLQLHNGVAPEQVRSKLVDLLKNIPYDEVVEVEQELISEGLPTEEVLKFCDIHTQVLEGHIDQTGAKSIPAGHPVDTFKKENRELERTTKDLAKAFESVRIATDAECKALVLQLKALFNKLTDIDKHYRRKENLLFPYLEKHGITGPPNVMWGKHDEVRSMLKSSLEALNLIDPLTSENLHNIVDLILLPATKGVTDMIMKEEEILFPMTMDQLDEKEWFEIYNQSDEIGFCLYDPRDEWVPEGVDETELLRKTLNEGSIKLPSGSFTTEELKAIFNTIPVDITFVDKNDKVKFFTQGRHRIFDRNRAILGRDVRMCHPPQSVHTVEKILNDFKEGSMDSAPFWIQTQGKFIYINYFPLRDSKGKYLGTIEFSQDLTDLRALQGEKRLLNDDQSA